MFKFHVFPLRFFVRAKNTNLNESNKILLIKNVSKKRRKKQQQQKSEVNDGFDVHMSLTHTKEYVKLGNFSESTMLIQRRHLCNAVVVVVVFFSTHINMIYVT